MFFSGMFLVFDYWNPPSLIITDFIRYVSCLWLLKCDEEYKIFRCSHFLGTKHFELKNCCNVLIKYSIKMNSIILLSLFPPELKLMLNDRTTKYKAVCFRLTHRNYWNIPSFNKNLITIFIKCKCDIISIYVYQFR